MSVLAHDIRIRTPHDPFFNEGDIVCAPYKRLGVYDIDFEEFCHRELPEFSCNAPGCTAVFTSAVQYESHYNSTHRYHCAECRKWLPSPHLLDLHVSEVHDSFFQTLAERKPMYQCFVQVCSEKFMYPKDRLSHCIEHHNFPSNFRFEATVKKKTASKLHVEHSMEVDSENTDQSKKKKWKKKKKKPEDGTMIVDNVETDHSLDAEKTVKNVEMEVAENVCDVRDSNVSVKTNYEKVPVCHFRFGQHKTPKMWHSNSHKKSVSALENPSLEKDMRDSLPST